MAQDQLVHRLFSMCCRPPPRLQTQGPGVVELEGIIISLIHWLSSRLRKGWITRDVLLERPFGDRAKRQRWLVDRTLAFRWEGIVVGLLDCQRWLALIQIAGPSVVHVHDWLL